MNQFPSFGHPVRIPAALSARLIEFRKQGDPAAIDLCVFNVYQQLAIDHLREGDSRLVYIRNASGGTLSVATVRRGDRALAGFYEAKGYALIVGKLERPQP